MFATILDFRIKSGIVEVFEFHFGRPLSFVVKLATVIGWIEFVRLPARFSPIEHKPYKC